MTNNTEKPTEEEVDNVTIELTESEDQIHEIALLNDEYRSKQLKRFDTAVSDAAIKELKDTYLHLKVTSVEDKSVVKMVREGRLKARGYRLGVDKLAETIVEAPKLFIKAVHARRDEIIEELKSFERLTQAEEDRFKQLKIEADDQREKDLQEKFDARLARLVELKMEFAGDRYVLGTDAHITNMEIADFSDTEFDAFIENIKPIAADIIRKKEAIKQLEERKISLRQMGFVDNGDGIWSFHEIVVDAEKVDTCDGETFDAILANAKVVSDRVKQEMEDFKENQKKIKEDQEKLKQSITNHRVSVLKSAGLTIEENTAEDKWQIYNLDYLMGLVNEQFEDFVTKYKEEVEKKQRGELRSEVLKNLKFSFHSIDETYRLASSKSNLNIKESALQENTEEDWVKVLEKANQVASEVKEDVALAERTDKRIQDLASRGFKKEEGVYEMKYFVFGDYSESEFIPENSLVIIPTQLDVYTDEQWNDLILEATAFQKSKTENELLWQQFTDKEKEKAAEIRRTALLPDKKKLIEFSAKVAALWKEMPEMDTAEGKVIRERQLAALNGLAHTIKAEAEAMS